jgi:hypothetical protein
MATCPSHQNGAVGHRQVSNPKHGERNHEEFRERRQSCGAVAEGRRMHLYPIGHLQRLRLHQILKAQMIAMPMMAPDLRDKQLVAARTSGHRTQRRRKNAQRPTPVQQQTWKQERDILREQNQQRDEVPILRRG